MDILKNISTKVTKVFLEVQALNPDEQIMCELVDKFESDQELAGRVIYVGKNLRPIIQLSRNDVENKNPELEQIAAHELLHIFRRRKLFPRVRCMPTIHTQDGTIKAAHDLENFVDHIYIFSELERRDFDISMQINGDLEAFRKISKEDKSPILHFRNAFHIALLAHVFGEKVRVLQELERNIPYSVATAEKIYKLVLDGDVSTPDGSRRITIKLIKLMDELTMVNPPFIKRLNVDLVLSRNQLNSPAIQYVYIECHKAKTLGTSTDIMQFIFRPNPQATGVCFLALGYPTGLTKKNIEIAQHNLSLGTMEEYLAFLNVPYAIRD